MTARALNADVIAANPIEANPIFATVIGDIGLSYPPVLDNALVWMDDTTIVQSLGVLINWANKGTGGNLYDLNTIIGAVSIQESSTRDVLYFDGESNLRPSSLVTIPQSNRVYVVYQLTDLSTQSVVRLTDSFGLSSTRHGLAINKATDYHWAQTSAIIQTPDFSITTNIESMSALFSGASSSLEVSGLPKVLGDTGDQDWDYCVVGANFANTPGQMMIGTIHTLIVFDGILPTDQEDAEIRSYIKSYWNVL